MKEIWKDVKGYEGIYQVSNLGSVVSLNRYDKYGRLKIGKIISTKINNRGYVQVHLHKNGKTQMALLHRLVAEVFIDNSKQLSQVNHKDENKQNNCVDNLEWCTNIYNRRYGNGINKMSSNRNYKNIVENKNKKILQFDLNKRFIRTWKYATEIKKELNINDTSVCLCCNGKQKTAGGFIWEYDTNCS